jgi:hypothetical protein
MVCIVTARPLNLQPTSRQPDEVLGINWGELSWIVCSSAATAQVRLGWRLTLVRLYLEFFAEHGCSSKREDRSDRRGE